MGAEERVKSMRVKLTCGVKEQFDVCWMALCTGRVLMLNDGAGRQSREDRRRDTALVTAFTAISTATDDKMQTNDKKRVLVPGGTIDLTRAEVDRLVALIDRIGWPTDSLLDVDATITWLTKEESC